MQFINIIAIFLGFLGLAVAQDAAATTSVISSMTETSTRTIRVSQVSTVTSLVLSSTEVPSSSAYVTVSHNSTMTTMSPTSKMTLSASAPVGTGGVVPTKSGSLPLPTEFMGAAPALSAFGAAGAIAMAFAAML